MKDCSVHSNSIGGITLRARIQNATSSALKRIDVEVVTLSPQSALRANAMYHVEGVFPRGAVRAIESAKSAADVRMVPWSRTAQLGTVEACFAQAAVKPDGTTVVLYDPM